MTSVPYAPKLGQAGSEFYQSSGDEFSGYVAYNYTQEAQLLFEAGFGGARVVHGSQALITANLKNLSEYLVSSGIEVKAWSFFSGELRGAEMVHQAKQEPEDVLELTAARSFEELYVERANEKTLRMNPAELWQGLVSRLREKLPLKRAYLVDDWIALLKEFESRESITGWGHSALGAMLLTERTQLFACVPPETPFPTTDRSFPMATHRNMGLLEFEGYDTALKPADDAKLLTTIAIG